MMKLLKLLVATITSLTLLGTAAHAQGTFFGTNPMIFSTGVTSLTEGMRIDSGQNVNIGNQGALFPDVFGSSPRLQVTGTGTNAELNLRRYSADQFAAQFSFVKSRGASPGSNVSLSNGDTLGYITFDGFDTNPTLRESASILAQVDAGPDASSVAGRLVFGTNSSGTNGTPTERMRIDSGGHVNIGSGGPTFPDLFGQPGIFQLTQSRNVDGLDFRRYRSDQFGPNIIFLHSDSDTVGTAASVASGDEIGAFHFAGYDASPNQKEGASIIAYADAAPTVGSVPGRIVFFTSPSGGSPAEVMRIDSIGRVNIGNGGPTVTNFFGDNPNLQITNVGGVLPANIDMRRFSNDSNPAYITADKGRGTTGTPVAVQSGDELFSIDAQGYDATGTPVRQRSVRLRLMADAAPTAGSVPGRLVFDTNPSGTNGPPLERMRIDSKGHVNYTTPAPTASACAGFALGTGSSDTAGRVTFTSATSCAISFGTAFTNAPFCTVSPGSAASTVTITTSTTVLTATFGTANTSMFYQCYGS